MTPARRRQWVVVVLLLVAAILVLVFFARPRPPRTRADVARTPTMPRAPRALPLVPAQLADLADGRGTEVQGFVAATRGRPMKLVATVEPARVCAGQPYVVNLVAHDPDGKDDSIVYAVNDLLGSSNQGLFPEPGHFQSLAQAYNLRGDYEQLPVAIEVQRCDEPSLVMQIDRLTIGQPGQLAYRAHLPETADQTATYSYAWDFGDGSKATTTAPYAEHDFRHRKMDRVMSTFRMHVVATSGAARYEGSMFSTFANLYFMNTRLKGILAPDVIIERTGIEGSAAVIHATVRHWEAQTIHFTDLTGSVSGCHGGTHDLAMTSDMFSTTSFPPGETALTVSVPLSVFGDGCSYQIEMQGTLGDDIPLYLSAGGRMRDPDPATAPPSGATVLDTARVTADPVARAQLERLDQAARILHRDPSQPGQGISEADLMRLEAEGRIPPLPPAEPTAGLLPAP